MTAPAKEQAGSALSFRLTGSSSTTCRHNELAVARSRDPAGDIHESTSAWSASRNVR